MILQDNNTANETDLTDISGAPESGRLMALDPGTKRVGLAVSDELQMTVRPLAVLTRTSWKKLLVKIKEYIEEFDAKALVVGLPLSFEGEETDWSREARGMARNLSLSLSIPVYLQDERLSTYTARGSLFKRGKDPEAIRKTLDGESAAVILSDFIELRNLTAGRG